MAKATKKAAAKKSAAGSSSKKAATKSSSSRSGGSSSSRSGSGGGGSSSRSGGGSSSRSSSSSSNKKAGAARSSAKPSSSSRGSSSRGKTQQNDQSMMQELFLNSLKDIYWAEKALVKALGKLSKAATSQELKGAFTEHQQVTEEQVRRLERVFEIIGQRAQGKKCEAMEGLTKEADEIVNDTQKGSKTRDVGLIMAAQKVEHYEIATYGSLATLAKQMGMSEAKELLGQTLQEEKETDELLTQLAESSINLEAEAEDGATMPADDGGEVVGGGSGSRRGNQ